LYALRLDLHHFRNKVFIVIFFCISDLKLRVGRKSFSLVGAYRHNL